MLNKIIKYLNILKNKYNGLKTKYNSLKNKYYILENKYNSLEDKYYILEDKYNSLENKKLGNNNKTAINGYKEELNICKDINNNNIIKTKIINFIKEDFNNCIRLKGNSKVDISSKDKIFTVQVKKYKKCQFQQLDRHWIDDIIKYIPDFNNIKIILKGLCEIPLIKGTNLIDKKNTEKN